MFFQCPKQNAPLHAKLSRPTIGIDGLLRLLAVVQRMQPADQNPSQEGAAWPSRPLVPPVRPADPALADTAASASAAPAPHSRSSPRTTTPGSDRSAGGAP